MERLLANVTHSKLYGPDGHIIGFNTNIWDITRGQISELICIGSNYSIERHFLQRGSVQLASDQLVRGYLDSNAYLDALETQMPVYNMPHDVFSSCVERQQMNAEFNPVFRIHIDGVQNPQYDYQIMPNYDYAVIPPNLLKGLVANVEMRLQQARDDDLKWS
jgi:hypothetical protein